MTAVRRREVLGSLGLGAVASGLACSGIADGSPSSASPLPWRYLPLDPAATAERTYRLYPEGHCMHAVFTSIVGELGRRLGPPHSTFPFEMMAYGLGGVAGWGALCGALNGAAAVLALFVRDEAERFQATQELLRWHELTALPVWAPAAAGDGPPLPSSVAGSVLCHVSSSRWCGVAGHAFFSPERLERCKRLSADVAAETVAILNRCAEGRLTRRHEVSAETRACQSCHTSQAQPHGSFGDLACGSCHAPAPEHPRAP